MRVSRIHVSHYRCFESLMLDNLGKVVCLVGANGSGKSSILDLLTLVCGTRKGNTTFVMENWTGNTTGKTLIIDFELSEKDSVIRTGAQSPPGIFNLANTQPSDPESGERGPHFFNELLFENTKDHFILFSPLRSFVLEDYGDPYVPQFDGAQYRNHRGAIYQNRAKRLTALMTRLLNQQREHLSSLIRHEQPVKDYKELDIVHDIFNRFFKITGKEFLNGQTSEDGRMSYLFRVPWSSDPLPLSALSSGEQWLLFFFLEIRLNEWKNHVILIDEIENHLHPRLAIEFVKELMSTEDENQYWVTTHSPSIARYLKECTIGLVLNEDQKTQVVNSDSIALLSTLTGHEAVIPIGKTIVLLEGERIPDRTSSIDETFFEELSRMGFNLEHVQFVSVGTGNSVKDMGQALPNIERDLGLGWKVYAIRDRDAMSDMVREEEIRNQEGRLWIWERSSLEGYFIEPTLVTSLLLSKQLARVPNEDEIEEMILKHIDDNKRNILDRFEQHLVYSALPNRGSSTISWLTEANTVAEQLNNTLVDFKEFLDDCLSSKEWRKVLPYVNCKNLLQKLYGRFLKKKFTKRENLVDLIQDIMRGVIKDRISGSEDMLSSLEEIWPEVSLILKTLSIGSTFPES